MPSIGISDTSGSPISIVSGGDVVDVLDSNYIDASSTNIPASSSNPLNVVDVPGGLADNVNQVQCIDTTGEFIGLYSDPNGDGTWAPASPVLECIFGPGCDQTISVQLSSGTVLGLRNMKNAAITVGDFALNLIK